jgi:AraC-like DNA-binding protein
MSTVSERWGEETIELGYTAVPNLLLRINALEETKGSERITAAEMFVLLVILGHWIRLHVQPYPSIERIARYTGLSPRHVRRIVRELIDKNYLTVHRHGELDGRKNSYNPSPLIDKLGKAANRLKGEIHSALVDDSITRLEVADRLGLFSSRPSHGKSTEFKR